ncbi:MAG: hypothetical protein IPG80_01030 [Anaerolineales bacterium]|uniref:hypothetical protein n=1 Tax=Candidatus Villigracilis vicinus TaxID=3140679 RepID=UPI0031367EAE|nr:hypothetical protein [Anaerolineales bacterium]MBK7450641.1 hypothetical protein [Anaerolineales bacterium]
MRTQTIEFPDRKTQCIFPVARLQLSEALTELNLESGFPVIVLIGGAIEDQEAVIADKAIHTIARLAQEMKALVVCGGTDMGVMAVIGQVRSEHAYTFPLVGITLEDLVAWPGGPQSTKFLWWGKERWQLEPHYPYFILVPGSQFGDESAWIDDAAAVFSKGFQSVTVLINGGEISRKDIQLSLERGRPVIALSRTGRLADEISRDFDRNGLITVVSGNADERISEAIRALLHVDRPRASS